MITLYYAPVACSLAVHIALEEAGVAFETVRIDLTAGAHQTPEYRRINPRERVPALAIDGEVVTEVPALLTYVSSLNPPAVLVPPAGSLAFARCFEWLAFLSSSVHIFYAQFRRPQRFLPPGFADPDAFIEQGRVHTETLYREIEGRIAGPWALGADYSLADAYLLPFFLWGGRIGLDMAADCPRWTTWKERMVARPAVARALAREGVAP